MGCRTLRSSSRRSGTSPATSVRRCAWRRRKRGSAWRRGRGAENATRERRRLQSGNDDTRGREKQSRKSRGGCREAFHHSPAPRAPSPQSPHIRKGPPPLRPDSRAQTAAPVSPKGRTTTSSPCSLSLSPCRWLRVLRRDLSLAGCARQRDALVQPQGRALEMVGLFTLLLSLSQHCLPSPRPLLPPSHLLSSPRPGTFLSAFFLTSTMAAPSKSPGRLPSTRRSARLQRWPPVLQHPGLSNPDLHIPSLDLGVPAQGPVTVHGAHGRGARVSLPPQRGHLHQGPS